MAQVWNACKTSFKLNFGLNNPCTNNPSQTELLPASANSPKSSPPLKLNSWIKKKSTGTPSSSASVQLPLLSPQRPHQMPRPDDWTVRQYLYRSAQKTLQSGVEDRRTRNRGLFRERFEGSQQDRVIYSPPPLAQSKGSVM